MLERERVDAEQIAIRAALDLRYVGQWHELTVPIDRHATPPRSTAAFHAQHDRLFGYASPEMPIEAAGRARRRRVGSTDEAAAGELDGAGAGARPRASGRGRCGSRRPARCARRRSTTGLALAAGARIGGPCDRRAREHDDRRARRLRPARSTASARSCSRPARARARRPGHRRGAARMMRCGVIGTGALGPRDRREPGAARGSPCSCTTATQTRRPRRPRPAARRSSSAGELAAGSRRDPPDPARLARHLRGRARDRRRARRRQRRR